MNAFLEFPGMVLFRCSRTRIVGWLAGRTWRAGLLLAAVAYFFHFPSYDVAIILHEMDDAWKAVFTQVAEPFTDHNALYEPESHSTKLAFRFVPALMLKALGVRTIVAALLVQCCLVGVFYGLLFHVLRSHTGQPRTAFWLALTICFIMAGHVHPSDYRGIFDILALTLLLVAVAVRRTIWVVPAILLAAFTDERALMATPALILLELYLSDRHGSLVSIIRGARCRPVLLVLFSWVLYFLLRYALGKVFGLYTSPVDLFHYLGKNIPNIPYGIYIGLEGHFLAAGMATALFIQRKNFAFILLLGCCFLVLQFFALCVVDINRSLSYLLLCILLIWIVIIREKPSSTVLNLAGWVILVSSLYDDFFPLPVQLARMAFVSNTLLPLENWIE